MKILKKICGGVLAVACIAGVITWNELPENSKKYFFIYAAASVWLLFSKTPEREEKDRAQEERTKEELKTLFKGLFKLFGIIADVGASILGGLFFGLFTIGGIAAGLGHKSNEDLKKRHRN